MIKNFGQTSIGKPSNVQIKDELISEESSRPIGATPLVGKVIATSNSNQQSNKLDFLPALEAFW